jgi:hypothetical protein
MPEQKVTLSLYDIDTHSMNCNCGLCGANKKSYGVAIFAAGQSADPLNVEYGPSEPAAFHNARVFCQESNLHIQDDIVQNPDGSHTGHPSIEFAETLVRIYCPIGHIMKEIPLEIWIGSADETSAQDPAFTVTCSQ